MNQQDLQIRQQLRRYAAGLAATHTPPPASLVWLRAQHRRRRLAVERAARPVRIMQFVAVACAVLAAAWCARGSGLLEPSGEPLLLLTAVSLVLALAGGCAMFLVARRSS